MLWESQVFGAYRISPGLGQYYFEVPNVLVTDKMTWTLQLANCSTAFEIGSRFVSPPTIGTSQSYLWNHTGGIWEFITFDIGGPNSDLGCSITAEPAPIPGDANCDGRFNGGDIDPFFLALADPVAWQQQYPDCDIRNLDINGDGMANGFDIDPFFIALGGGSP